MPRVRAGGAENPSMSRLALTLATGDSDRVRAIADGRVAIEGCTVNHLTMPVEEVFHRSLRNREFDVVELGFSPYLIATSRGIRPYIAIPVFLSRTFRHSAIYIRTDRGIASAADLRGKRIGVPEYQQSAALWIRGFLNDEHGIGCEDIQWVQAGLESSGRRENFPLNLPPGFPLEISAPGSTLSGLLADGAVDAVFSARAPSCVLEGKPNVGRLYPDFRTEEQAYFRRSGHFPIMHAVGIREDVLAANPWLPMSLMKAFYEAKRYSEEALREVVSLKIGLPWAAAEYQETQRVMGEDFWPYGVDANRGTLDAMTRYSFEQHLAVRKLDVDELFAPGTLDQVHV
jgi:4,5-dihydroxyphthalate decarboxylase